MSEFGSMEWRVWRVDGEAKEHRLLASFAFGEHAYMFKTALCANQPGYDMDNVQVTFEPHVTPRGI
jgi:hypothetical protein